MITGKLYNWLKWSAQIVLPALGTFLFLAFKMGGLENGMEIVGIIMAVDLFFGLLLVISQVNYNKSVETAGELIVKHDGRLLFQLDEKKTDLEKLGDKKEIRFKVEKVNA